MSIDKMMRCESLAKFIWSCRNHIKNLEDLQQKLQIPEQTTTADVLPVLNNDITHLLSNLVTSSFIVETQPPQVLKKDSRFSASVRLLVGGTLNLQMTPPQVMASAISEQNARILINSDGHGNTEVVGPITNNSGHMEYQAKSGIFNVTFRNMKLNLVKRTDRKGQEQAVTEEKSCILFKSSFSIVDLQFHIWTLSLPVVVTVHGNQECNALATVSWDNHFAAPERKPFEVPDTVPWPRVADLLDCKFKSMTGRGLNPDNKNYLGSKLFGGSPDTDYSCMNVTWNQFNRETLPGRSFTFWDWTYGVMKLLKESLKQHWVDGTILGFVSKVKAQEMLSQKPSGTFLLRFSDSETGGITVAWIAEDNNNPGSGSREVWNLSPYTGKDFGIRCLSDRLKDLLSLVYLYPDRPKDQVFSKYYKTVREVQRPSNGYVLPELKESINIPGAGAGRVAQEMDPYNPQTPQSAPVASPPPQATVMMQSPEADNAAMIDLPANWELEDFDEFALDYTADDLSMNVEAYLGHMS